MYGEGKDSEEKEGTWGSGKRMYGEGQRWGR